MDWEQTKSIGKYNLTFILLNTFFLSAFAKISLQISMDPLSNIDFPIGLP
jgi:regulatory protein YycI of two-component signal transduction system YycFG